MTDWALPVQQPRLEKHYAEVRSFQEERVRRAGRSSMLAWSIATASMVANIALSGAVTTMIPLHRPVPMLLIVNSDGTVDSGTTISELPASQSEAIIRAAVWEYVKAREGYSFAVAQAHYDLVTAMSDANARDTYQRGFLARSNPDSVQLKVGRKGQVDVQLVGLSFVRDHVALVRFWKTTTMYGEKPVRSSWSATVGFDLVERMSPNARLVDPSGLKVTQYQSGEDSP